MDVELISKQRHFARHASFCAVDRARRQRPDRNTHTRNTTGWSGYQVMLILIPLDALYVVRTSIRAHSCEYVGHWKVSMAKCADFDKTRTWCPGYCEYKHSLQSAPPSEDICQTLIYVQHRIVANTHFLVPTPDLCPPPICAKRRNADLTRAPTEENRSLYVTCMFQRETWNHFHSSWDDFEGRCFATT